MSVNKCSKCKRRESVFYRYLSRESLCGRCLIDRVRRVVKKNLSLGGGVKPGCTIVVPINPLGIIDSVVALKIVLEVESRYNSKTIAVAPSLFIDEGAMRIIAGFFTELEAYLIDSRSFKLESIIEAHHFLTGLFLKASRVLGASVLINPLCFEKNAIMPITSFLHARPEGFGDCTLSLDAAGVSIVNVFRGVSCQETTFIAYEVLGVGNKPELLTLESRIMSSVLDDIDETAISIVLDLIAEHNTESLYTLYKNEEILNRYYSWRKCKWCYGYSVNDELCYWCRKVLRDREPEVHLKRIL